MVFKAVKMRLFFLTVIVVSSISSVFGTPQETDVIFYENKVLPLYTLPLSDYYKTRTEPNFQMRPGFQSTANWRGYIAYWEINDESLYLRGIESFVCQKSSCRKADLKDLFGEKCVAGKVWADWYTGKLVIFDGQSKEIPNVIGVIYERTIELKIEAGKVTEKTVIDNWKKDKQ
jgi:hypothetical protein